MNADGGEVLRRCLPADLFELYAQTSRRTYDRRESVVLDDQLNELSSQPHLGPPNEGDRPHTGVHRRTLRSILRARLGDSFHPGKPVTGYAEAKDHVAATLADGTTAEGDVLVGADGIRSAVRTRKLPGTTVIDTGVRGLGVFGRTPLTPELMEYLPFGDATFDAVTGVNAFQFAGNPQRALREAARVTRPGGRVVASLFAVPERSQGTVVHEAMSALIPPDRAADHAPYSLSAPGHLEAALADAGLSVTGHGEVVCHWRYASMDDAVKALLCSAGGARAVEAVGQEAVRDVLRRVLAQFQDRQTGVITLVNTFRWVAASRRER